MKCALPLKRIRYSGSKVLLVSTLFDPVISLEDSVKRSSKLQRKGFACQGSFTDTMCRIPESTPGNDWGKYLGEILKGYWGLLFSHSFKYYSLSACYVSVSFKAQGLPQRTRQTRCLPSWSSEGWQARDSGPAKFECLNQASLTPLQMIFGSSPICFPHPPHSHRWGTQPSFPNPTESHHTRLLYV